MILGAVIPFHPDLAKYLKLVKSALTCNIIVTKEADFKKVPEHKFRNDLVKLLHDFDWVWTLDADEVLLPSDQRRVLTRLKSINPRPDCVFLPVLDWTDLNLTHVYAPETHRAVVLVKPYNVNFVDKRCVNKMSGVTFNDIFIHHLGYVMDKNEKLKDETDKYNKRFNDKKVSWEAPRSLRNLIRRFKDAK